MKNNRVRHNTIDTRTVHIQHPVQGTAHNSYIDDLPMYSKILRHVGTENGALQFHKASKRTIVSYKHRTIHSGKAITTVQASRKGKRIARDIDIKQAFGL